MTSMRECADGTLKFEDGWIMCRCGGQVFVYPEKQICESCGANLYKLIGQLEKYYLEFNDINDIWTVRKELIYAKTINHAWKLVDLICFNLEVDGFMERDSEVFLREC